MPSIYIVDESELRELQAAAKQRVDALEKAAKKADDEYRPEEAAITRRRLDLWRGGHGDGLLDRIDDQMSLYEPAFTDNGKVPDGQQEMFDGQPREEEPQEQQQDAVPQVGLGALKAALILSLHSGRVGDEAFEQLDGDVPDEQRIAYLGRAPINLLAKLNPEVTYELFAIAVDTLTAQEMNEEVRLTDAEVELFDQLATMIAMDGEVIAPYYEPFPTAENQTIEDAAEPIAAAAAESWWLALTRMQLGQLVRAVLREEREGALAAGVDQETLEKQEHTLIHAAATGEEFKFCVEHAHTEALERALAVIEGLEGNVGREKAIRRQLKVRAGEPGAEYDLTEARLEALKILARADGAILSARVTDPDGPTVNWIACNYLEAQGLAEEPSKGRWTITHAGRELAAKLSLLEDEQEAEAAAAAAETEAAEEAVAISSTSELLPF